MTVPSRRLGRLGLFAAVAVALAVASGTGSLLAPGEAGAAPSHAVGSLTNSGAYTTVPDAPAAAGAGLADARPGHDHHLGARPRLRPRRGDGLVEPLGGAAYYGDEYGKEPGGSHRRPRPHPGPLRVLAGRSRRQRLRVRRRQSTKAAPAARCGRNPSSPPPRPRTGAGTGSSPPTARCFAFGDAKNYGSVSSPYTGQVVASSPPPTARGTGSPAAPAPCSASVTPGPTARLAQGPSCTTGRRHGGDARRRRLLARGCGRDRVQLRRRASRSLRTRR